MTGERFDEESGLEALGRVRHWYGQLPGVGANSAEREEIITYMLVAAAEALTFGMDEHAVQAAGNYTARQMTEVRAVAAEIHEDDEEIERESRTTTNGGQRPRSIPADDGRRDPDRPYLRLL
ncbi:hypothetical protein [Nocardia sp. NPDC051570]|uniref:hypothetical protein n=1 Tax=Nocardia sp. NPDC051570 TaxID=3364324 RepID=UPI0037A46B80